MIFTWSDLIGLAPEIVLCATAIVILLLEPALRRVSKLVAPTIAVAGMLVASFVVVQGAQEGEFFGGTIVIDAFTNYFKIATLMAGVLSTLLGIAFLKEMNAERSEYYPILIFSLVGVMISSAARDLVVVFLGLELLSISTYVLVGFLKADARSREAAAKYFLLSTLASAIMLFGFSFLFGLTGATQYDAIASVLRQLPAPIDPLLVLALVMILVGVGFKITVIPFHMYVPDVYQGAPTSVTAFLSVAPKLAGFAVILRMSGEWRLIESGINWVPYLWIISALTMFFGNLIAVWQENIKRMLAYSSIAHAGFLFMGITVAQSSLVPEVRQAALAAILFYLFAYLFMKIGAFAMVSSVIFGKRFVEYLSEFRGLGRLCPKTAFAYMILLLSLSGIPPTVGFVAKFQILAVAIRAEFYWLAVIGILSSAIALFYYLRVVFVMYFRENPHGPGIIASIPLKTVIGVCAAAVVFLGIFPAKILQTALSSVDGLF